MKERKYGTLDRMTRKQAVEYLTVRSQLVRQTTLDRDRTIMDRLPRTGKTPLPRIHSKLPKGNLATKSRAPEHDQLHLIESRQREQNAVSTALAWRCGVRAHELLTIKRFDRLTKRERARLERNQKWDPRRLAGRDGVLYVVRGKGGMMRIVVVPHDLAARLEARFIPNSIKTRDRKIFYIQHYDIQGGKNWSASFERASIRAFGYSLGGHGCRHTFAQDRLLGVPKRRLQPHRQPGTDESRPGTFQKKNNSDLPSLTVCYTRLVSPTRPIRIQLRVDTLFRSL